MTQHNIRFTQKLYGHGQFRCSVDKLELSEGFISYHNWMQHAENPAVVFKNLAAAVRVGGRIYLSLYHGGTFRIFKRRHGSMSGSNHSKETRTKRRQGINLCAA